MIRRDFLERSLIGGMALNADGEAYAAASVEEPDAVTKWTTLAAYGFRRYPNHEHDRWAGPDIIYGRADNIDLTLHVFTAGAKPETRPTLIYIHGGGWVHLMKEDRILYLLPYLAQGMNAVNVDYRLAHQSRAPAAVEDCRTALQWVHKNADEYGFDRDRIVVAGESAGGHLALMTGMLTPEAGFDNPCAWSIGELPLRVAAIVDVFGPTDLTYYLQPPHTMPWALEWFGSNPERMEVARRISPLTYVRSGLPPTITIHGEADRSVPYEQSVRLHDALDRVGVPHRLVGVPDAPHGWENWSPDQRLQAQMAILNFLREHKVL
jgi:acetyl esterase/lipase